jgi:hypothetical protein
METDMGGDKENDTHTANVDEEENVRATKKLKVGEKNTSDNNSSKSSDKNFEFPVVIL